MLNSRKLEQPTHVLASSICIITESLFEVERRSFVCEDEHVYVADFMNTANVRRILGDKWENYQEFGEFFARKACCITNPMGNGGLYPVCLRSLAG